MTGPVCKAAAAAKGLHAKVRPEKTTYFCTMAARTVIRLRPAIALGHADELLRVTVFSLFVHVSLGQPVSRLSLWGAAHYLSRLFRLNGPPEGLGSRLRLKLRFLTLLWLSFWLGVEFSLWSRLLSLRRCGLLRRLRLSRYLGVRRVLPRLRPRRLSEVWRLHDLEQLNVGRIDIRDTCCEPYAFRTGRRQHPSVERPFEWLQRRLGQWPHLAACCPTRQAHLAPERPLLLAPPQRLLSKPEQPLF